MSINVTYDNGFGIDSYQSNATSFDELRKDLFYNSPEVALAWFSFEDFADPYDENGNTTVDPDYDREAYRTDCDAPIHKTVAKVVARIEESIAADDRKVYEDYDLEGAVRDWITEANHNIDEPWTDRNLSLCTDDEREVEYIALVEQMRDIIEEASYVPEEVE